MNTTANPTTANDVQQQLEQRWKGQQCLACGADISAEKWEQGWEGRERMTCSSACKQRLYRLRKKWNLEWF